MNTLAPIAGTSPYRPLRHAGNAAVAALLGRLAPAWVQWCGAWGLDAGRLSACQPGQQGWRSAPCWEPIGAWAWLGSSEEGLRTTLSRLLFDTAGRTTASAQGGLAEAVVASCLDDLKACLATLVAADAAGSIEPKYPSPSLDQSRRWSGALQIHGLVGTAANAIWLQLAPEAAAALLAPQPGPVEAAPPRPPLAAPSQALAATRLHFRVELSPARLPIGSLRGLEIGDTLTLPHRLDAPLEVRPASDDALAPPLCEAYLGRRGARRAIELIASGALP